MADDPKINGEVKTDEADLAGMRKEIEDSNRKAADERLAREAAERREADAKGKLADAHDARVKADEEAAEKAITAANAESERLEIEYDQLMQDGKFKEAARIQAKIASTAFDLRVAQNRKAAIADWKAQQAQAAEQRRNAPAAAESGEDPRVAAFSPKVKAWIKDHPQFLTDTRYYNRAMRAHYAAMEQGIENESPEYFDFVNEQLGGTTAERKEPVPAPKQAAAKAAPTVIEDDIFIEGEEEAPPAAMAPPDRTEAERSITRGPAAAPVSRRVPAVATAPRTGGTIRLSQAQAEAARASFPDLSPSDAYREYARGMQIVSKT